MSILLDTGVIVDHLRGRSEAAAALTRLRDAGVRPLGSVLTRTELVAGSRPHQERALSPLLRWISWIDVDQAIADEAGRLIAGYRASHGGIDIVDYLIAATASISGGVLWTTNRRHFPMLGALPDPYEPA